MFIIYTLWCLLVILYIIFKDSPHEIFSQAGSKNDIKPIINISNVTNDNIQYSFQSDSNHDDDDHHDDGMSIISLNDNITNKSG